MRPRESERVSEMERECERGKKLNREKRVLTLTKRKCRIMQLRGSFFARDEIASMRKRGMKSERMRVRKRKKKKKREGKRERGDFKKC